MKTRIINEYGFLFEVVGSNAVYQDVKITSPYGQVTYESYKLSMYDNLQDFVECTY